MGWMGRVRLIRADGTCEHYEKVRYLNKWCHRCSCWFLACPKCKPSYCPTCREEMKNTKIIPSKKINRDLVKDGIKANLSQQTVGRLDLKKKAWRKRYQTRKRQEAADQYRENILDLRENVKNLQARRDG